MSDTDAGPSPEEAGGQQTPSTAKLFLGGLSWDTTEDKLRHHFGQYGSMVEAVVMRDRQTGRPRGFGFVTFTSPAAAEAAVAECHVIDGRQIDAKKSVPQEMKPKARKVFVGGLSPETTEDQFRQYFSQYGEVVEAQIMQDHMSGRSRGFGFVTFAEDASAESVFAAGTMHDLGGKKVEVKPATPKGSGSLSRPGASGAVPGRPGGPPGGGRAGGGMPGAFGGPAGAGAAPGALFGSPPGAYGSAFGMYGFAPPGMMPAGAAYGMPPYGGQYGMGPMAPAPYMMGGMQHMQHMQQSMGGSYPPGAAAYGFPGGAGMPGFAAQPGGRSGGGGGGQLSPSFAQQAAQQQAAAQQYGQQLYPRPLHLMSRNGSRGKGKVDSASSLEGSGEATAAAAAAPPQQQQAAPHVAAVEEQLAKVSLAQ